MNTLTPNDYLIICGDFGGVWDGSKEDEKLLNWYARQPYTTLFVDGNHENHTLLSQYPVEGWYGGKIHRIRLNLIHLMRGQYYTIDGKTFLTMGGAVSTDRMLRTENVDWWAAELPSAEEIATLRQTMEDHNYTVDYIITHCAPTTVLPALSPYFEQDEIIYNDCTKAGMTGLEWYCRAENNGGADLSKYESVVSKYCTATGASKMICTKTGYFPCNGAFNACEADIEICAKNNGLKISNNFIVYDTDFVYTVSTAGELGTSVTESDGIFTCGTATLNRRLSLGKFKFV